MGDLRDWENQQDDLKEQREKGCIDDIFKGLTTNLKDYEEYFLQEAIKKLHLDGQKTSEKIKKVIKDVLNSDENKYIQHIQQLDVYINHFRTSGTRNDGLNLYVDALQKKITEGLSDEEVNRGVMHYLAFLQRGREYTQIQGREIHRGENDVENFILFVKEFNKREDSEDKKMFNGEESVSKLEKFLKIVSSTIDMSTVDVQKMNINKQLVVSLEGDTINFPSKGSLSVEELENLEYIESGFREMVDRNYGGFIEDISNRIREQKISPSKSTQDMADELIQEYRITDNPNVDPTALPDYLERLKDMVFKNIPKTE